MKRLAIFLLSAGLSASTFAAISVVGVGTVVQSSASQTLTIPCVAGQANDVRLYVDESDGAAQVPTPKTTTVLKNATSIQFTALLVSSGTDPDVQVVTGTSTQQQYQCVVLRGVDISAGLAAAVDVSITASNSSTNQAQYNAFTPGANNEILIIAAKSNGTWSSIGTLSNFTHGGGGSLSSNAFDWSYWIQGTATAFTQQNATFTPSLGSAQTQTSVGIALKAAATGGSISITSVGGTNVVTSTQTGVAIAGTGFGASQGAGSAQMLEAGGCTQPLTVTGWANTTVTVTMSQGVCLFGPSTVKVTENGGTSATAVITLNPPAGTFFANLSGGLVPISFDLNGAPTRPYGFPLDLQSTSQLMWSLTGTGACTVLANAAMSCDPTVTRITWDFSRNGVYLGAPGAWDLRGPPPTFKGPKVGQ